MVKLQGEVCATHRKLSWKLMTVMAIACLAASCAKIGQKHALKSQLSSISYAKQAQRPPLKPTHPLYIATTHWAGKHRKSPQDPSAALNYARNLKALGSREKALEVLARTYQLNPGHTELASEYGRMALSLGKVQLAEQLLNQISKDKRREDWKLLSALGTVNAKRGDHKKAQSYYLAALRKKPGATSVYNNLALSYALDGRAGEAEKLLKKAISKGHDTPRVRQNLVLVLGLQTKFGEARQMARADLPGEKAAPDADNRKSAVKTAKIAKASRPAGKAKRKTSFITTAMLPSAKKTTRKAANKPVKTASKAKRKIDFITTAALPSAKKTARKPAKSAPAAKSEVQKKRVARNAHPALRVPAHSKKTGKQTRSVKLAPAGATANKRAGKPAETLPWHKQPAARKVTRTAALTSTIASKRPGAGATSWRTTASQGSMAKPAPVRVPAASSQDSSDFIFTESE